MEHNRLPAQRAQLLTTFKTLNRDQVQTLEQALTPSELQCVVHQFSCVKFCKMQHTDQWNSIVDIVSEVKLLTGAIVYEGEMLKKQLQVLHRFIATGFSSLSKEEIVQAFYLNSQGELDDVFSHYGKEMNAEFIGNVLRAYLRYKKEIAKSKGRLISGILNPPPVIRHEIDYDTWKEILQRDYECFKMNRPEPSFWHQRKYYTMRKFGLLPYRNVSSWVFFMKKAMAMGRDGLLIPANANLADYKITRVQQLRELFATQDGYERCVNIARQLAVGHAFGAMAACGINDIWNEIKTTE